MIKNPEIYNHSSCLKDSNINIGRSHNLIKSMFLTYFNPIIGPKLFTATKKDKDNQRIIDMILNLMDIKAGNGNIFIFSIDEIVLVNQVFIINSHWGRGGIETLMITFAIQESDLNPANKKIISYFIKSFIEVIRRDKELYQGFYQSQVPFKKGDFMLDTVMIEQKAKKIHDIFNSLSEIFAEFPFSS